MGIAHGGGNSTGTESTFLQVTLAWSMFTSKTLIEYPPYTEINLLQETFQALSLKSLNINTPRTRETTPKFDLRRHYTAEKF